LTASFDRTAKLWNIGRMQGKGSRALREWTGYSEAMREIDNKVLQCQKVMIEATEMRAKEAKAFSDIKAEYNANINAVISALESLIDDPLTAATAAQTAVKIARGNRMNKLFNDDCQKVIACFSASYNHSEKTPRGGEITGILFLMGNEMAARLEQATAAELNAITVYEDLMTAKTRELAAPQSKMTETYKKAEQHFTTHQPSSLTPSPASPSTTSNSTTKSTISIQNLKDSTHVLPEQMLDTGKGHMHLKPMDTPHPFTPRPKPPHNNSTRTPTQSRNTSICIIYNILYIV